MKTTLSILALSVLLFAGCEPISEDEKKQIEHNFYDVCVLEFDSCEYVTIRGYHILGLAHKGNCKYCEQRRKEEQK